MRLALAVAVAAVATSAGAVMLGEYELVGVMPYLAAVLFGLALAELTAALARQRSFVVAAVSGSLTGLGLIWAAWIQSGRDWAYVPGTTWIAAAAGAVASALWVRSSALRGSSSRPGSSPRRDG